MRFYKPSTLSIPALIAWAIGCIILIPPLLGRGGFIDGLLYASISRNLSQLPWQSTELIFSDTFYREFAEHPPLMLWMGSWWFRWLGDHAWTEKILALLMGVFTLIAFYYIWKMHISGQLNRYGWGWWMLLWSLVPGPLWGLGQFMLENLLTLLTFLAVWSAMGANRFLAGIGLGLFTGLAFITKGPPALFPLAAPMLLGICRLRPSSDMMRVTAWSSVVLFALAWVGWLWSPLRDAMLAYWRRQVHAVFSGQRPSYEVGSERTRIDLVWTFIQELSLPVLLLLVCYLTSRWLKNRNRLKWVDESDDRHLRSYALFFMLVALSATAPLFVSPKLHPHYLIPSYPWWTLAMTCATLPVLRALPFYTYQWGHLKHDIILSAGVSVCVLGCFGYAWTKRDVPVRDFSLQSDLNHVVQMLKHKEENSDCRGIALSHDLHGHYAIWLYMQRYYSLSLSPNHTSQHCIILKGKDSLALEGFSRLPFDFSHFDAYSNPSTLPKNNRH
jgi:4-amino-4-deoxy-L-arabinose transferase-like glycosyltransferase